jgi:scyllo-inositol 2-dehydrogenase (NADP+)
VAIRTAILGYGRSGSSMHAGGVQGNDAFEMAAVCDIDPARQKEAAERFKCATYDAYHAMLERERLDLVIIVTRSDQHCEMTCDCLAAGVNVLVTKPWAVNEAEARRMVAAAKDSGKLLLPWLPARWGADLRRLRQLVAEKAIGEVFLVRRTVCSFSTRDDWQMQRRFGGGYLLNWGPHIVDPPVLLMGSTVESVYGRMKQTINPGDAEDLFIGVLTLANGAVVQVEFTPAIEELPSWFVQGDQGTIVVRGKSMTVHRYVPAPPGDTKGYGAEKALEEKVTTETLAGDLYGNTDEIYAEIAQAVRGERPFAVTPADALELSRILDAIRTASEEDRVVKL